MSNDSRHISDDLLVKYITKEADASEIAAIEKWLLASDSNQQYYEALLQSWIKSGESYSSIEVNTAKAWDNLSNRIDQFENKKESKSPSKAPLYYVIRIAAVLVVGLFVYQQFFLNKPQSFENLVAQNSLIKDTLSDGSVIALNTGSELSFPKEFKGNTRNVQLKGEAFFDIAHDKEHPFIIEAELGFIKVLGTSFNVVAKENSNMEVQVETGLVELSWINENKDTTSILLAAGTSGIIDFKTGALLKNQSKDPASSFWLDRKLSFNKTPLVEVFEILEQNYELEIDYEEALIQNCKFTSKFENSELETIMAVIATAFNLDIDSSQSNLIKVQADDPNCTDENS